MHDYMGSFSKEELSLLPHLFYLIPSFISINVGIWVFVLFFGL